MWDGVFINRDIRFVVDCDWHDCRESSEQTKQTKQTAANSDVCLDSQNYGARTVALPKVPTRTLFGDVRNHACNPVFYLDFLILDAEDAVAGVYWIHGKE